MVELHVRDPRGKMHVREEVHGPALKGARCPWRGGSQNVASGTHLEKK